MTLIPTKVVLIRQKPIKNGSYFHVFPIPTQAKNFAKKHQLSPKNFRFL
jgi:hypothetical protein